MGASHTKTRRPPSTAEAQRIAALSRPIGGLGGIGCKDAEESVVEQIRVEAGLVLDVTLSHAVGPALGIEAGPGSTLVLSGQYLLDHAVFAAQAPKDDPDTCNGLPEPHAFPCATFTVVLLPRSGTVLSITTEGAYVAPARTERELPGTYNPPDAELIEAPIDSFEAALQQKHATGAGRRSG